MTIAEILRPEAIIADLTGQTSDEVLAELCRPLAGHGVDHQRLLEILIQREKLGSTGIGDGVAIPHGKVAGGRGLFASFGRSRAGIDFKAIDGKPTRLFFTLFVPEGSAGPHLRVLARASLIFRNPVLREAILDAKDSAGIYRLVAEEDAKEMT